MIGHLRRSVPTIQFLNIMTAIKESLYCSNGCTTLLYVLLDSVVELEFGKIANQIVQYIRTYLKSPIMI